MDLTLIDQDDFFQQLVTYIGFFWHVKLT